MESELKKAVEQHPYFELTKNGKIKCKLTGHELPLRKKDFDEYQIVKNNLKNF